MPVVLYAPIWPGFAINTIFYAAILWLLAWGASVLRRFLRLRRGLCPKCAYPMGESSVCTECGNALPRRRRMANLTSRRVGIAHHRTATGLRIVVGGAHPTRPLRIAHRFLAQSAG